MPKERGAIAPKGFTRRYGNIIAARIPVVARDGLDACIYAGAAAPVNKAPPAVAKKTRPIPGEEYETAKPPPPVDNAVSRLRRQRSRRTASADEAAARNRPHRRAAGTAERRLSAAPNGF